MPVNDSHRPYLEEMRMLTRDTDGREVLVGLTFEETEWYFAYLEARHSGERHRKPLEEFEADREHFLEMHDRHEAARLQILFAESEARTDLIRH